jgi:hypothetical protein
MALQPPPAHDASMRNETIARTVALRTVQPVRNLQRLNAAFSAAIGGAMAAASGWLSPHVDIPRSILIMSGVGLIGWAALLVVLAVQPQRLLFPLARLVAAGDAVWVIGSAALIAVADPTTVGAFLVASAAAVVLGFAVAGVLRLRRARPVSLDDRTEILFGSVTVATTPDTAWEMVLDADLYARLAPDLTAIHVAPDDCSRTCTDTRGNTWSEVMHLDHRRHIQRLDVDTTDHPMALDALAATISVHDDPAGSRIDAAFTYVTTSSITGLATSATLPVLGGHLLGQITRGWKQHAAHRSATATQPGGRP